MRPAHGNLLAALLLGWLGGATVKAAPAGAPLWTNRYHGPVNGDNVPTALAVDRAGNVIVTGYSPGFGTGNDFATIKYSGAGIPLWVNRYNAPENYDDWATAVAVDADGNVFVAGYSERSADGSIPMTYVTLAYSSAGAPQWTNFYADDGNSLALAIAVDAGGNVFVTGEASNSFSGFNFATVAYSGAGVPLWTNWYNGPGNGLDGAHAIAVDTSGNVFVTGYSESDPATGVYDFATVAYSGLGVPLWTNRCGGPESYVYSWPNAIAVDNRGKVFVTGNSGYGGGTNAYYDYLTLAYSAAGKPLWTNRYDGPGHGADKAWAMAVDSAGNIFVAGVSAGVSGYQDIAVLGYSGARAALSTNRFNGPGAAGAQAKGIAADRAGNWFVTGAAVNNAGYYGYFTVATSSNGQPIWTNTYNGARSPYYSYPSAIAVDALGNVFVTGYSRSEINGLYYDYATIKYASVSLPYLAIQMFNESVVLTWTNSGFKLQSAPVATGTFTNLASATSPYTNSIIGWQQYFRLEAE